jgi:hypothetical protein
MCFKCNVFKTNLNFTDCLKNVTQGFSVFLKIGNIDLIIAI